VDLSKGGKELRLVMDDAADGYGYDDADFAKVGFVAPTASPARGR